MNGLRLLAGPDLRGGAETMQEHRRRLGPEPAGDHAQHARRWLAAA